ncbi:MAG: hypothetical protein H0T51_03120 [Pirellulales bacterium]|nr:hypothetical protein [Pirellulales bacterium]
MPLLIIPEIDANEIGQLTHSHIRYDSFTLFTKPQVSVDDLQAAIAQLQRQDVASMQPEVDERAVKGLKFTDCLSREMAVSMLRRRTSDYNGAARILDELVATIRLR